MWQMSWYIQKFLERDFSWLIPIIIIFVVYDMLAVAVVKRKRPDLNNRYYQLIIHFGVIQMNVLKLFAAGLAIFFLSDPVSPNYKPFIFEFGLMCSFYVITKMLYDAFLWKQSQNWIYWTQKCFGNCKQTMKKFWAKYLIFRTKYRLLIAVILWVFTPILAVIMLYWKDLDANIQVPTIC